MAKKKSDKETEPKKVSTKRFSAFFKNETTHFVIGLISVIFAVYLLLAFTSFFFTGAADQSILDNQQPGELMQTTNHVKNYAGARGAQLAEFLINECFGLAAYFIILFLAVVGMKLMKAYQFRIWKWFMSCSILLIWFSITLGFIFDGTFGNSFIYPGGLHGYNVSNWLISQVGIPGLGLLLFITALLFFVYLSNETIQIIRKALHPNFKRKKKGEQASSAAEESPVKETPRKEENKKEFSNPGPAIVDFELEQPEKIKEEVEDQVPFPFENNQVAGPEMEQEPAYVTEEEEVEVKDGKTKTTVEKTFPGYVLVEMVMSDQAWYVVRNTPGVTGFVGSHGAGSKPSPLLPEEVEAILGRIGEKVHAPVELNVSVGDYVIITEGAFNDMSGKVVELDHEKQKIKVAIEMFGRETIADLEFHQVKEDDSY